MLALSALAQALGVAWAGGINLSATVLVLGLVQRAGWVGTLPGALGASRSWWIIGLAGAVYVVEFVATLVPGVASIWETVHTAIRPPAAAALAAATVWHGSPGLILAATLLGGGLALTTHATKLGLRYAIDASPEPVSNGIANSAELGVIATMSVLVWHHPFIALGLALLLLVLLALLVRAIWRSIRRVFSGDWTRRSQPEGASAN